MTSETTPTTPDPLRIGKVTCSRLAKSWMVSFPVEHRGKRQRRRKHFNDEASARDFSDQKKSEIAEHGILHGSLPAAVRRAYRMFCERGFQLSAKGIEVPDFGKLVSTALDAMDEEIAQPEITVAESVERFLLTKKATLSTQAYHSLRTRLRQFARIMGDMALGSITSLHVEKWLLGRGRQRKPKGALRKATDYNLSAHAINHYRAALASLFGHAVKAGWIAYNPIKAVKRATPARDVFEILTPEQVTSVMFMALDQQPEVLPVLALQMFAGLRLADAVKTDSAVVLSQEAEQIGSFQASSSKGVQRQVPICNALRAWLAVYPNSSGLAWNGSQDVLRNRLKEVMLHAGVKGNLDSLRMTYLRYRLSLTGNVAVVAAEGSVRFALLESLSRILVTAEASECFFQLNPILDR